MQPQTSSRRSFIASSSAALGSAWIALHAGTLAALSGCARDAARQGEPFTTLTSDEVATMRAFATRILPSSDGLPGAEEAGAVYFVDRALGSFFNQMLPPLRELLADLDQATHARGDSVSNFAELEPATQDELMRAAEDTQGFFLARLLVVAGVFSDPSYGGNRDGAGVVILGIDPQPVYAPPFGRYDAEAAPSAGGAT